MLVMMLPDVCAHERTSQCEAMDNTQRHSSHGT